MINNNGMLDWAAYDTTAGVGVKNSTYTAQGAAPVHADTPPRSSTSTPPAPRP